MAEKRECNGCGKLRDLGLDDDECGGWARIAFYRRVGEKFDNNYVHDKIRDYHLCSTCEDHVIELVDWIDLSIIVEKRLSLFQILREGLRCVLESTGTTATPETQDSSTSS